MRVIGTQVLTQRVPYSDSLTEQVLPLGKGLNIKLHDFRVSTRSAAKAIRIRFVNERSGGSRMDIRRSPWSYTMDIRPMTVI